MNFKLELLNALIQATPDKPAEAYLDPGTATQKDLDDFVDALDKLFLDHGVSLRIHFIKTPPGS